MQVPMVSIKYVYKDKVRLQRGGYSVGMTSQQSVFQLYFQDLKKIVQHITGSQVINFKQTDKNNALKQLMSVTGSVRTIFICAQFQNKLLFTVEQ